MKKIADNPSTQLIKSQLSMVDERLLNPDQKIQLERIKKELDELSTLSDRFNSVFSSRGWIAYETMSPLAMKKALEVAKLKGLAQANDYLTNYYEQNVIGAGITGLWGTEPFRARLRLIKLAYEDYLCGRYHACIPVLLAMIDGVVADAGNNLGFFSEKSDVTAWDSIAGHESGLLAIKSIFYASRGKTDKNKLTLPHRNGIMHGRDLGYANQEVAAKCWAMLFAIRDLLAAKRDEEANRKKYEIDRSKSFKDIQQEMQALHDSLREVDEMDFFRRKPVVVGVDVPASGASIDYAPNTPEKALVEFIELWQMKRYGPMADCIYLPNYLTRSKMAGRIREVFNNKYPHHFSLTKVHNLSSCKCDITVTVSIAYGSDLAADHNLPFRLLYCKKQSTELVVNPVKEGRWKIVDDFSTIRLIGTTLEFLDSYDAE